jgi:uncharacterized protein YfeS
MGVIVYVMTHSATSFGGNSTFSLVGDYLESGLGSYGGAIRQISVTAGFRGVRVRNASLQRRFGEFHSKFLPSLPLVKFLRKKGQMEIEYETATADATFLERYGFLSAAMFSTAFKEVADKLHLMDARLQQADDFELPRFHDDVARLASDAPTTDEALRALRTKVEQQCKERLAAMDPWERLDLDWDEFHPAARTLLDDPFFWSQGDDYAPHGNDTGADLFADFKKWNRRHPDDPPHEMVTALLRAWQIAPSDYRAVDEDAVKRMITNDPIALSVTDDAFIAGAFAAIKCRGCCEAATRDFALAAIERERMSAVIAGRGWKDPDERLRTLDLLRAALANSPNTRA